MRRVALAVVLALFSLPLLAECIQCKAEQPCSFSTPQGSWEGLAPRCVHQEPFPGEKGVEGCRNVAHCGGCIGFTCLVYEPPAGTNAVADLVLVSTSVTIASEPPVAATSVPHEQ